MDTAIGGDTSLRKERRAGNLGVTVTFRGQDLRDDALRILFERQLYRILEGELECGRDRRRRLLRQSSGRKANQANGTQQDREPPENRGHTNPSTSKKWAAKCRHYKRKRDASGKRGSGFGMRLHGHGHQRANENCGEELTDHGFGDGERAREGADRQDVAKTDGG